MPVVGRCEPPWPSASQHVRTILEYGRREYLPVLYNGTGGPRVVVYWVTPKVAHTKIGKLMRLPPFYPMNLTSEEMRSLNNGSMFNVGRECLGPACGTDSPVLSRILHHRPFEFTFWREPVGHLISGAAQAVHCLNTYWCIRRELPWGLQTASDVASILQHTMEDQLPPLILDHNTSLRDAKDRARKKKSKDTCHNNARCTNSMPRRKVGTRILFYKCKVYDQQRSNQSLRRCMRHIYPQSTGYGWHPLGLRRLHFVGRMESFIDDWRRLLHQLGESEERVRHFGIGSWDRRVVNKQSRSLAPALGSNGSEWMRLSQDARVRALLSTERCVRLPD